MVFFYFCFIFTIGWMSLLSFTLQALTAELLWSLETRILNKIVLKFWHFRKLPKQRTSNQSPDCNNKINVLNYNHLLEHWSTLFKVLNTHFKIKYCVQCIQVLFCSCCICEIGTKNVYINNPDVSYSSTSGTELVK